MWENWGGNQRCNPVRVLRPGSTSEVARAVREAARAGHRVRVAGSGHSFTGACCTDGVMLVLDRLDQVLTVDVERRLVRVQAGITLHALNEQLAVRGMALPNLGDVDVQTLGGALATGTHGTGVTLPNLSAQVAEVRLVDGRGEVRHLDASTPDLLRAARVSIGAVGVVTEVTLQCVPAYVLRMVTRTQATDQVLADLETMADTHRHYELFAFPHTRVALVKATDVVDGPARPRSGPRRWVDDVLLENHVLGLVCRLGRRRPGLVPRLNRAVTRMARPAITIDQSHRALPTPRLVRFVEMEYAVSRSAAPLLARTALRAAEMAGDAVNFPIELRFSAGDDALLSPAQGRDTAWVAVHAYRGMPHERFFKAVEETALALGGRPHWGKLHTLDAADLAERYPEWEAFQRARAMLDPDGVFGNEYIDRVLGPVGAMASP